MNTYTRRTPTPVATYISFNNFQNLCFGIFEEYLYISKWVPCHLSLPLAPCLLLRIEVIPLAASIAQTKAPCLLLRIDVIPLAASIAQIKASCLLLRIDVIPLAASISQT
jgi:hypothetical protein